MIRLEVSNFYSALAQRRANANTNSQFAIRNDARELAQSEAMPKALRCTNAIKKLRCSKASRVCNWIRFFVKWYNSTLKHCLAQFWKYFGDFIEKIIAISPTKFVDTGFIPALALIVIHYYVVEFNGFDFNVEIGIKEEWK